MNFLVDMPLSPALVQWLKTQGHDAVHASEMGLYNAPDIDIVQRAIAEKRVIITADLDFPRLLAQLHVDGPGLMLFRSGNYNEKEVLELLIESLSRIPLEDLASSVIVIEKNRIRRRRLPLG